MSRSLRWKVFSKSCSSSVQELAGDLHDRLAIAGDGAADLDHLARVLVDDGIDSGGSIKHITLLERARTWEHAEAVGKMHELEQVTIDGAREDRLGDGFPTNDDGEVHWCEDFLARSVNECLSSVANGMDEVVDRFAGDHSATTIKAAGNRLIEWNGLVAKPDLVVELLDTIVATVHDLANRRVSSLWVVGEIERKADRLARELCGPRSS